MANPTPPADTSTTPAPGEGTPPSVEALAPSAFRGWSFLQAAVNVRLPQQLDEAARLGRATMKALGHG